MGLQGVTLTLEELSDLGVKRVSVGSALTRAAYGEFLRAAREMKENGTFNFADKAVGYAEVTAMLSEPPAEAGGTRMNKF
jgi:2-methylisocitrate lyase-like PEP mutase family enzyme